MRNRIERMLSLDHCTVKTQQISGRTLGVSRTGKITSVPCSTVCKMRDPNHLYVSLLIVACKTKILSLKLPVTCVSVSKLLSWVKLLVLMGWMLNILCFLAQCYLCTFVFTIYEYVNSWVFALHASLTKSAIVPILKNRQGDTSECLRTL